MNYNFRISGIGQDGIDILNYPDKQFQLRWIRDYLMCKATYNGAPTTEVTDDDVETYYVKANKFALVRLYSYQFQKLNIWYDPSNFRVVMSTVPQLVVFFSTKCLWSVSLYYLGE